MAHGELNATAPQGVHSLHGSDPVRASLRTPGAVPSLLCRTPRA